jgi:hypothetical protein
LVNQSIDTPLFVDAAWIRHQLGCSLSGAYVVMRDIGAIRLGSKRRLVRVRREDFDRYVLERREVAVGG